MLTRKKEVMGGIDMDEEKKNGVWSRVKERLISNFVTDRVLRENETKANLLVAKTMILISIVLGICWILNMADIFKINKDVMNGIAGWGIVELLLPMGICTAFRGEKKWLKYLLMIELIIVLARIDSILSYNVTLTMLIPVVLSCRYYSRSFTVQTSVLTTILFAVSAFSSSYLGMAEKDLNFYAENAASYLKEYMIHSFVPKWMIFIVIATVCANIARSGKEMVMKQDSVSREHTRVETELEMARRIQNRALPIVHDLPQLDNVPFDLAAIMEPAKEVGGDFYDFMYLDSTHLALMIADVSGKGIPAALFMMVSKLLLDNSLMGVASPGLVLSEVNHQLCQKKLEDMFVTVWLGVLDLETGDLVSANAGHEYPAVCRKNGNFELIRDKHGLVLGGMDGMRYKETVLHLDPGDTMFVYTDGVPESNRNGNELFGTERMIEALNKYKDSDMNGLIKGMKREIAEFIQDAPQFDDTTMLALRLIENAHKEGITVSPDKSSIETVQKYVDEVLKNAGVPSKAAAKINVSVDELYSNIVYYSGAKRADVICTADDKSVTVVFRDNGIPFNPLKNEDPDITLSSDEREIGGLGIYMTRKIMSSIDYVYETGLNKTTIRLDL